MSDIFDVMQSAFEQADARADAVRCEVEAILAGTTETAAVLVDRLRGEPDLLGDLERALQRVSEESDDRHHRELTFWRALLEANLRSEQGGERFALTRNAVDAAVLAETMEGRAGALEEAEALVERARAGAGGEDAVSMTILLAEVRMNRGVFEEALLEEVLAVDLTPRFRRRVLADLGVVRFARGRYVEAFATWNEAASVVSTIAPATLGFPPADVRGAEIHAMRLCFDGDAMPELAVAWGLGGPMMIPPLFAFAAELDAHGDSQAATVRAEAEARFERGVAAWFDDDETGGTEAIVADIADRLEQRGLTELARDLSARCAAARPTQAK